jgi:hypothetical protein
LAADALNAHAATAQSHRFIVVSPSPGVGPWMLE